MILGGLIFSFNETSHKINKNKSSCKAASLCDKRGYLLPFIS